MLVLFVSIYSKVKGIKWFNDIYCLQHAENVSLWHLLWFFPVIFAPACSAANCMAAVCCPITSPYPVVLVRWGIWWVWNRPVLTEAEADCEMRSRGVSDLSDVPWAVFFSPSKHQQGAIRKCDIEVCSRQWWNLADLLGIFQALLMIDSSWTVSQCLPLRLALSDPKRRQPKRSLCGKPPLIARL